MPVASGPFLGAPAARAAPRRRGPGARARARPEPPFDADRILRLAEGRVDAAVGAQKAERFGGLAEGRAQPHGLSLDHDVIAVERLAGAALGLDFERPG